MKDDNYIDRDIAVDPSDYPEVSIFPAPMGPNRDDRGTRIDDKQHLVRRSSNIMMGYNKDGIQLENGEYASWDEVRQALLEYTSSRGDNETLIVKETGKTIEPLEMVRQIEREVLRTHSSLVLNDDTSIKNQDTRRVNVREKGKNKPIISKGVLMLGNNRIKLPCGEYVSAEELVIAIDKYAIREHLEKKENTKYKVLYRKYRNKALAALCGVLASVIILASMYDVTSVENFVTKRLEKLEYKVEQYTRDELPSDEAYIDQVEYVSKEITTGDEITVPAGVHYYRCSDHKYTNNKRHGTFSKDGIRHPGDYTVEYISVLYNGRIQNVAYETGANLADIMETEAERLGCDKSDLEIMLHIGNKVSGWVDLQDLIEHLDEEGYLPKAYVDHTEEFEGECALTDTIKFDNGFGKEVEVRIVDDEGNLLKGGTKVIGSDGLEYSIIDLKKTEVSYEESDGYHDQVSWTIRNVSPGEALLAGSLALAALIAARKKKEYTEMTDGEIKKMVDKAHKSFEQTSDVKGAKARLGKSKTKLTDSSFDHEMEVKIAKGEQAVKDFLEGANMNGVPKRVKIFDAGYRDQFVPTPEEIREGKYTGRILDDSVKGGDDSAKK